MFAFTKNTPHPKFWANSGDKVPKNSPWRPQNMDQTFGDTSRGTPTNEWKGEGRAARAHPTFFVTFGVANGAKGGGERWNHWYLPRF